MHGVKFIFSYKPAVVAILFIKNTILSLFNFLRTFVKSNFSYIS